jgi:hypothetical protein
LGSGEHTNNSDDSSFVLPKDDGNRDEDSKAPEEKEAVHDDSSDDNDSDGLMDRYHRDNAARRLQAVVQLKIFEDKMEEEGRRAELEQRALLTDAEDPPNKATPTAHLIPGLMLAWQFHMPACQMRSRLCHKRSRM